ncbi:MAG: AAA family ATPase, partial [Deltaproteobacteria bacterium CG_4_10_14_0_2_um_filter_43_8]
MQSLIETYQRLNAAQKDVYIRNFYSDFVFEDRLNGIVGPRGVGKTTFLLHFLSQSRLEPSQKLYVSADNLYFVEHSLVSLVDQFVKEL